MSTKKQVKQHNLALELALENFSNAMSSQQWHECETLALNETNPKIVLGMFNKAIQGKNIALCEKLLRKSPQLYKDETIMAVIVEENQLQLLDVLLQKEVSQTVLTVGLQAAFQKNNTDYAKKIIPHCSQIVLNTGFNTSIGLQKENFIKMFIPVCRYHVFLHRNKGLSQETLLQKCIEEYESQLLKDKLLQELNHIEPKVSRSKAKI